MLESCVASILVSALRLAAIASLLARASTFMQELAAANEAARGPNERKAASGSETNCCLKSSSDDSLSSSWLATSKLKLVLIGNFPAHLEVRTIDAALFSGNGIVSAVPVVRI